MKEWAIERGATCFTHWFHPLNDTTARKYESFISLKNTIGFTRESHHVSQFTGKQLVQGEPDGSSFPTGGLRSTSKARGYTAWDCTSPAFVKLDEFGGCLYVPATFSSMFGLSLDSKTPLLKSERLISTAGVRAVALVRRAVHDTGRPLPSAVYNTIGLEQELFVLDRRLYDKRPDLVATGRTLFGSPPLQSQSAARHYWGPIPAPVLGALDATQGRLFELGVPVAAVHNEAAPCQFELAPSFERASVSSDHNMLLMQVLDEECKKRDLVALFHEKPFAHVNGSGKHTNWSLATDTGENLFSAGAHPHGNLQFLFFFTAFIRAVSLHNAVLRAHIACPGNEFRLGGMEAPPAIISVFVGEQLEQLVRSIVDGTVPHSPGAGALDLGVASLPKLRRDVADRNRTSPLAFVGDRFEFRAVGSSQNPANPITAVNAIVADSLNALCDDVERAAASSTDTLSAVITTVIRDTLRVHFRIIYNGDCYAPEYVGEMTTVRGIPNLATVHEALAALLGDDSMAVFKRTGVLSVAEVESRADAWASRYSEARAVEAATLVRMVKTEIYPSCLKYQAELAESIASARKMAPEAKALPQEETWKDLTKHIGALTAGVSKLEQQRTVVKECTCELSRAKESHRLLTVMEELGETVSTLETTVAKRYWPYPTFSELFTF